ncbi:MAG: hypothetical protein ACLR4Z_15325 [Butyricicoccaceae bacterium]
MSTLLGTIREGTTTTYYYDREEAEAGDKILLHYYAALGENTFYQFTGGSFTSSSTYPYSVKLYETQLRRHPCDQRRGFQQFIRFYRRSASDRRFSFAGICALRLMK